MCSSNKCESKVKELVECLCLQNVFCTVLLVGNNYPVVLLENYQITLPVLNLQNGLVYNDIRQENRR